MSILAQDEGSRRTQSQDIACARQDTMDDGGFSRGCGGDTTDQPEAVIPLGSKPMCRRNKVRLAGLVDK